MSFNENQHLCDIGFIGLGVMGKSLVLNLADNNYKVACFDLNEEQVARTMAQDKTENTTGVERLIACASLEELVKSTKSPRVFMLSVPAGKPVDAVCSSLIEAGISQNDVVVDTGNSLWTDSVAREQQYKDKFVFFSTAVSGGEEGARFGPSLMPSGDEKAWPRLAPIFEALAAKVDTQSGKPIEDYEIGKPVTGGEPCSTYIGPIGSGHYVKMVHNGIEYADMQLICEAYHVMSASLGMRNDEIASVFEQWNDGVLNSYLMEISAEVLAQQDPESNDSDFLVDKILDMAGQKGTGLWTAVSALQKGSPAQTIAQAVFARSLSALKKERVKASKLLDGPSAQQTVDASAIDNTIQHLHDALYCAKICAYAQGFQLMATASAEHEWKLNFGNIAKIWRGGCIIRAIFLQSITEAFESNPELENLLLDDFFAKQISLYQSNWRKAVAFSAIHGIPTPAISSALNYYDSYRCEVLPANLLQGQRDFFGAHSYARTDKPSDQRFHVTWSDEPRQQIKVSK